MRRTLCVVLLGVLVGFGAGCKDKAAETAQAALAKFEAQAQLEVRNVELIKTVIAELEKGKAEVFQRLFAPDFKLYFPSNSTTPVPREDAMGMAKMMATAMPDLAYKILDIFPAGDRVFLRLGMQGTHRMSPEGIPPVETKLAAGAMIIYRIKDGLVVEEIIDGDALGIFRQLGLELQPKTPAK